MVIIEKYKLSKMCYIDDIKDDIFKVFNIVDLTDADMKYLRVKILSGSAFDFIYSTNFRAKRMNKHFMYKKISIITKSNEVYNIVWNLKKEFPVFIIGRIYNSFCKLLDENFSLQDDNIPDEIASLLHDFKEQYLKDEKIKLK